MNTLADLVVGPGPGTSRLRAAGAGHSDDGVRRRVERRSRLRDRAGCGAAGLSAGVSPDRDLQDPATFAGWLRRIVITVALNMRRARAGRCCAWTTSRMCRSWTKRRRDGRRRSGCGCRARC